MEVLTISWVCVVVTDEGSRLKMGGMDDDVLFVHEYASPHLQGASSLTSKSQFQSTELVDPGFMSIIYLVIFGVVPKT